MKDYTTNKGTPKSSIYILLNDVLKEVKKAARPAAARWDFRASGQPICARDFVFWQLTEDGKRPPDEESFRMDFYTEIGTAVHSVMQRWLGRVNQIYGNWSCQNPKCQYYEAVVIKNHLGVGPCPHCDRETIYEEYLLTHSSGLSAHPDGLLPYEDGYLLWEFKTTGLLSKLSFPRHSYLLQTNIYAALLEDAGMPIKKIAIVYISLLNPEFKVFLLKPNRDVFNEIVERYLLAKKALHEGEVPIGLCFTPAEAVMYECPWKEYCFDQDPYAVLSKLHNSRGNQ